MKFSIRDLLLVTVIVALATGWWVDRTALTKSMQEKDADLARFREYDEIMKSAGVVSAGRRLSNPQHPPSIFNRQP
jgi:hypothetical protein